MENIQLTKENGAVLEALQSTTGIDSNDVINYFIESGILLTLSYSQDNDRVIGCIKNDAENNPSIMKISKQLAQMYKLPTTEVIINVAIDVELYRDEQGLFITKLIHNNEVLSIGEGEDQVYLTRIYKSVNDAIRLTPLDLNGELNILFPGGNFSFNYKQ